MLFLNFCELRGHGRTGKSVFFLICCANSIFLHVFFRCFPHCGLFFWSPTCGRRLRREGCCNRDSRKLVKAEFQRQNKVKIGVFEKNPGVGRDHVARAAARSLRHRAPDDLSVAPNDALRRGLRSQPRILKNSWPGPDGRHASRWYRRLRVQKLTLSVLNCAHAPVQSFHDRQSGSDCSLISVTVDNSPNITIQASFQIVRFFV